MFTVCVMFRMHARMIGYVLGLVVKGAPRRQATQKSHHRHWAGQATGGDMPRGPRARRKALHFNPSPNSSLPQIPATHFEEPPSPASPTTIAGSTGSSTPLDPARKYGKPDPLNRNNFLCNFCSKITKGGAYRMKQHLVGGFKNVTKCPQCSEHVREEVKNFMLKREEVKATNLMSSQDFFLWC
ncbi:hypothetical protein V6N12_047311 [Hibiscus sabdariffa]|uniref:BED-type domain-containing protein n=1 Tax=Hibiscus sabdariffa TaxID=183260 RepID=A0ABR2DAH4_9ROSI